MKSGTMSALWDWIEHPTFSDGDPLDWTLGLVLVLCVSFLWARVTRML